MYHIASLLVLIFHNFEHVSKFEIEQYNKSPASNVSEISVKQQKIIEDRLIFPL